VLRGLAADAAPAAPAADAPSATGLLAPTPGVLVRWLAESGSVVAEGDAIAVLDAMKMETTVRAHRAGRLTPLAQQGATVGTDQVIGHIE
jgi:acetyl-CoA/propionyl-CoA carboxylase biotin carboxyl carrier protein